MHWAFRSANGIDVYTGLIVYRLGEATRCLLPHNGSLWTIFLGMLSFVTYVALFNLKLDCPKHPIFREVTSPANRRLCIGFDFRTISALFHLFLSLLSPCQYGGVSLSTAFISEYLMKIDTSEVVVSNFTFVLVVDGTPKGAALADLEDLPPIWVFRLFFRPGTSAFSTKNKRFFL